MDYAVAVNEEIKDLFAAGADIVQVDEPYMQARPQKAEDYGLTALNRALDGVMGTTAVHICFGYAAIIHERPNGYSFLSQLKNCSCRQVSIETAQSKLDCSVLSELGGKEVLLGVIDLSDMNVETTEAVASRIRRALPFVPAKNIVIAPDCGMKYLPRDVAFGKTRAMVEGAKIVRTEVSGSASSLSSPQLRRQLLFLFWRGRHSPRHLSLSGFAFGCCFTFSPQRVAPAASP